MSDTERDLTPLMKQYMRIKEKHKDAILLYRMGDFYEMFFEDAEIGSRALDITLTARDKGPYGGKIPLAGIPYHALDAYLPRLVRQGHKVVIVEQTEDPKKAKGIVKRDVVQIVTPGTMVLPEKQQEKGNTFLSALMWRPHEGVGSEDVVAGDRGLTQEKVVIPPADYGLAHIDVSTGDFSATEITGDGAFSRTVSELLNYGSVEVIIPDSMSKREGLVKELRTQLGEGAVVTSFPDHNFMRSFCEDMLKSQLSVVSLEGFGLCERELAIGCAGAVLAYARENQMCDLGHIGSIRYRGGSEGMVLDATTIRNLEVLKNSRDHSLRGTLLELLDQTRTAMGSRAMRSWMQHPLTDVERIDERLDAVSVLSRDLFLRSDIKDALGKVSDLDRILMRLSTGRGCARDLISLKGSLEGISELKRHLAQDAVKGSALLARLGEELDPLEDVLSLIDIAIKEDPPLSIKEGGMIRPGYSPELDEVSRSASGAREWLKSFEDSERNRTGIRSLKVKFNNVFGYFIEVTKANLELVPPEYMRKQTISNGERFITPDLKEKESLILNADERIAEIERGIFEEVVGTVLKSSSGIQKNARAASALDVINSLSDISQRKNYVRPIITEGKGIRIEGGRHPVIEDRVPWGFVPNDAVLSPEDGHLMILTGPNMAGKSTYMRQVALIAIMAQMGCYVPARSATIGVIDRIFTRVGASDDLSRGQSTFMVEMLELAGIINGATERSLILLDEIGRGTSTYDGMALAWAVVEHLASPEGQKALTLFATHYHQLTSLEGELEGVVNYQMSVAEDEKGITFLRKVARGAASRSYGIDVAKLAGVPPSIVERAREVLSGLESEDTGAPTIIEPKRADTPARSVQMVLFPTEEMLGAHRSDPVKDELERLDPNNMTPLEALEALYRLRKKLSE